MTKDELNSLKTLDQNPEGVKGVRRATGRSPLFRLESMTTLTRLRLDMVRNVSEAGVCLEGIEASVGDVKGFVVRSGTSDHPVLNVFRSQV